jgi:protein-tyrosine-phosphatase
MARAVFDALAEDGNLPFRASSAGTAALEGRPMAPNAVDVLAEVGIYPEAHRACQVRETMVEEAELVLAMTPQHAVALRRLGGKPARGIYTLPEYATGARGKGIADPYGLTVTAYRNTLRQLYEHVERVVCRLGG